MSCESGMFVQDTHVEGDLSCRLAAVNDKRLDLNIIINDGFNSMSTTSRSLTRSRSNRVLAGVMGGIARRFGWNVTLTRVLFVILSIASAAFPGILVYLILWLLIPDEAR